LEAQRELQLARRFILVGTCSLYSKCGNPT
jgi:hypothetical protein